MLVGLNIYAVAFLAAISLLGVLLAISQNQNITHYMLMFFAIIVANMGAYTVSTAESMEAALMGHRLIYLGGVFAPVFMLFSTMKLCQMRVPKWLVSIFTIMSVIVLYLAFSVGHSTLYYKNVTLGKECGMTVLIKEYGSMHWIYMVFLFGNVFLTIGVVLYSYFTNKNIPRQVTFYMLVLEVVAIGSYIVGRALHTELDLVPFAYVFKTYGVF